MGFFPESTLVQAPIISSVPQCGLCKLYKHCDSPKMKPDGKGRRKILVVGEAPGCVSGDTLIDMAFRNKSKYPDGIPIVNLVGKKNFFVYSYSTKKKKLVLGKVKRVWKTGRKKTYLVIYEWKAAIAKGRKQTFLGSIKVTSNHKFLLKPYIPHSPFNGIFSHKNNKYLSIGQGLTIGDSLQPFYRNFREYPYIGTTWKDMVVEARFLLSHKIGRRLKEKGELEIPTLREENHHQNRNKLDDSWENLELHTTSSHAQLHQLQDGNCMDRPEVRRKHRKIIRSKEYRNKLSKIMKNYRLGLVDNHKIISIELIGYEDVYDMEVEKYHNFAANGIFVHNSREDEAGKPFIGPSGKTLSDYLERVGIDFRKDCRITNAAICFPHDEKGKVKTPTDDQIKYCLPNLRKTLTEFKPEIIIPLGMASVKAVLHGIWEEKFGAMSRWEGQRIPCQKLNAWVCPAFHPAYIIRELKFAKSEELVDNMYERVFRDIAKLDDRPWDVVPDYRSRIKLIHDEREIAAVLTRFERLGGPIAIDYETNMLKPQSKESTIVSASVCWRGQRTIAFPFNGPTVKKAWKSLLESDCPKIAHNIKFEDNWSQQLGIKVKNWAWDSMVQAHVEDNRRQNCSLSFQALTKLGLETYGTRVSKYLETENNDSYEKNSIHLLDISDVLLYNGLDSLVCYKIAELQRKNLKLAPL